MTKSSRYAPAPGEKYCPACEEMKPIKSFRGGYCLECSKVYFRDYRKKYYLKRKKELKERLISHYGGKCEICGETNINYLMLYPTEGAGQFALMERLDKLGMPGGYFSVCFNHQSELAKRISP